VGGVGVNADMLVYNLSQCGSGQYRLLLAATVDEEVRRAEWSAVECPETSYSMLLLLLLLMMMMLTDCDGG